MVEREAMLPPPRGGRSIVRWLWLLLAVAGAGAGLAYASVVQPTYTAQAYVAVVPDDIQAHSAAVSFAQAYGRMTGQPEVVRAVISDSGAWVGRGASSAEVRDSIRASTSPDAPVIEVSAQTTSPRRAAALANAAADGLVAYGNRQSEHTGVHLAVLATAYPPDSPASPNRQLSILVGAVAGLTAGAVVRLSLPTRADQPPDARTGPPHDEFAEMVSARQGGQP